MRVMTNLNLGSFGGIERIVADLFRYGSKDLEPLFLTRGKDTDFSTFSYAGIPTLSLPGSYKAQWELRVRNNDFSFVPYYLAEVERFIEIQKPDVALVNATGSLGYILSAACSAKGIPYFSAVHGFHSLEEGITNTAPERRIIGNSQKVAYVSEHARETAKAMGIIHPENTVLYNTLDPNFIRLEDPIDPNGVAWVGRNHPVKNLGLFLEIARAAPEKACDVITMPPLISDIPHNLNVVMPLETPVDLSGFYNNHSLLVSTSLYETFGNVALEAVASGIPAIVPDTMGVKEVFKKFGLGDFVVEGLERDEFLKKIRDLDGYRVPIETRLAIGDEFSAVKVSSQYKEMLEEVANRKPAIMAPLRDYLLMA